MDWLNNKVEEREKFCSCRVIRNSVNLRLNEGNVPWVPEATRLLNPAGQRPAKRA